VKVEEFVDVYSSKYMFTFHPQKKTNKSALDRITSFLFEPRYKVDNFKITVL